MDFRLSKLKLTLLTVATGAMVLSAAAQQAGQPIIFSTPPNDDGQSIAPSLAAPRSAMPNLPSSLQAPVAPFSYDSTPDNFPPVPSPQANSAEQQRMKQQLEDRKNWTLMTPEEIFSTPTDQSLQPAERDALGREKKQTQVERYLDRQSQASAARTNRWRTDRWNLTHGQDPANSFNSQRPEKTDASHNSNRFFGGLRNNDLNANQNENSGWDFLRTPEPQAPVKPTPEQVAAMERFRQLLAPSPAPTAEASPNSSYFPAPKPVVDPYLTRPDYVANPAGASFAPLSSGIGRPTGLTPLPGITTHTPPPAAAPSWAPKPPPWLSQTPQQFAPPPWKF